MHEHARPLRPWRTLLVAGVLISALLLAAATARADTLRERNTGQASARATQALAFGRWTEFLVGGTGSFSNVFTFRSNTPVLIRVTDALCRGDEFRIFDRGFAVFNTSTVGTDPSCDDEPFIGAPWPAWNDQSYSKGRFLLQPGAHRVRIRITDSPFGGALAFLRIDRRPVR